MAALPYIQIYIADYLADTMHLTTEEHGAYTLLIYNYWQTGKPIPKSRLAAITKMNGRWDSVEQTLSEFFNDTGTCWQHNRIDEDLLKVASKQSQATVAGKASAAARKAKKQTLNGNNSTDVSNPLERNANHTDTDTDTDINTIDTNVSIVCNDKTIQDCPHQEIISLYKKNIPMGIQPKSWDGVRATTLKTRWRERKERQELAWWDKFFGYVSQSKFLTGRVGSSDRKPFEITLPWILKAENFNRIIEGFYHR